MSSPRHQAKAKETRFIEGDKSQLDPSNFCFISVPQLQSRPELVPVLYPQPYRFLISSKISMKACLPSRKNIIVLSM